MPKIKPDPEDDITPPAEERPPAPDTEIEDNPPPPPAVSTDEPPPAPEDEEPAPVASMRVPLRNLPTPYVNPERNTKGSVAARNMRGPTDPSGHRSPWKGKIKVGV